MSVLTREGFHALTAQAKRDLQRSTDSVNVMVCAGTGCIAGGAMKVYEYLKSACERRGIPVAVSLRQEAGAKGIHLKKSGCHGFCEIGPLVNIEPLDVLYAHVHTEDCDESVRRNVSDVKYIVCNGDEGDPGAFMDQGVMEGNPHSVIEGMMIAGVATGGTEGYIYVRAEYPLAVKRLQTAIDKAAEAGLLGDNIMGTDFCFHIHINRGAGAFVCGEGSALTASIEGNRGMPRTKPPRTVEKGLWAKPTVLNNVETFANIPYIINEGANAYRAIGNATSPGTKAFALAGNIRHTGLIEVPMGTTLREIIFDIGGGIKDGKKFKAVQIGGPSGGCLTEEHLDLPLDYDSLKHVGAIMGSGGLVVMDEDTCMAEVARFFMKFTQKESCGKCIPCREGTKRMLEALERIVGNEGSEEDIELLEELSDTALCGLGQSACKPVQSTLRYFREDYERHVRDKFCPLCNGKPKVLQIDPEKCKGCSLCARNCPVEAIIGEIKSPFVIDTEKCIRCNACVKNCKFGAIREV